MAKLPTPIPVTRLLKILGNDIKVARIRRRITSELMAQMNFLFHWSTVSVDWSNTFMNVGANKIKYWRRKIAAFPLIGAKFLNY